MKRSLFLLVALSLGIQLSSVTAANAASAPAKAARIHNTKALKKLDSELVTRSFATPNGAVRICFKVSNPSAKDKKASWLWSYSILENSGVVIRNSDEFSVDNIGHCYKYTRDIDKNGNYIVALYMRGNHEQVKVTYSVDPQAK